MDPLTLTSASTGHIIPKNAPTQDAISAFDLEDGSCVGAVADGVGGSHRGDIAASVAVAEVQTALTAQPDMNYDELFRRVWQRIDKENRQHKGLATTLTVVRIRGGTITVGHVGDCRAYHLRDFGIVTLTEDQNEAEFLLRQGILDRQSARTYPRRNVLTSALSADSPYTLFTNEKAVRKGDRVVLMSDGAYSVIARGELAELNVLAASARDLLREVVAVIERRGVRDDASVLCLEA